MWCQLWTSMRRGLRPVGIGYTALNERALMAILDRYWEQWVAFDAIGGRISKNGLRYPPMRLVGMYFCEHGRKPR
jgi:hypothetical protein